STIARDVSERKRAEEGLQKYRLLSEHARDIILFVRSRDQRITAANEAAVRAYGYSREEILSLRVEDLRALETGHLTPLQMREAATRGILFETVHRRKDGSTFPVEVSSRGATIGGESVLLSIVRDITERKQAEAERERLLAELDATLASIADALIVYDPQGNILRLNAAAERLFGYGGSQRKAGLGERMASLQVRGPDGRPIPVDELPLVRALRGETVVGAVAVIQPSPERTVWLSLSAAPIRDHQGGVLGAVGTYTDITDLHNLQEQREDFIRTISHDLRQPLTVIQGQTQILQHALASEGGDGRNPQSLAAILAGAKRMGSLIKDLVDSMRMEAGQLPLHWQPTDLHAFLGDVLDRAGGPDTKARLHLTVPEGLPLALADSERLERAVMNLVTNALKYSPEGTPVSVKVVQRDGQAVVSVSDQGSGIPPEDLPHLFERYYRARNERRAEGLGLGLYIARLIIEAHGGRIWVESTPGQGSTFSFTVPLAK
ncbi:MAG: PAS domain-containing sensor histidine kinase, partial [Chloroflexota bacterium]